MDGLQTNISNDNGISLCYVDENKRYENWTYEQIKSFRV